MMKVSISSSLKYKEIIRKVINQLDSVGIVALFPNLDSEVTKEDLGLDLMQKLETEHFAAIRSSDVLYVICPNGYVGTLVSVEIGYAKAIGIQVVFSEEPEDLGLQALADGYIPLSQINTFEQL